MADVSKSCCFINCNPGAIMKAANRIILRRETNKGMERLKELRETSPSLPQLPREIPGFNLEEIQACLDGLEGYLQLLDRGCENPSEGWQANGLPESSTVLLSRAPEETYVSPDTAIEFKCFVSDKEPATGCVIVEEQSYVLLEEESNLLGEVFRKYDISNPKRQLRDLIVPPVKEEGVIIKQWGEKPGIRLSKHYSRNQFAPVLSSIEVGTEEFEHTSGKRFRVRRTKAELEIENGCWTRWTQSLQTLGDRRISSAEEIYNYHNYGDLRRELRLENYNDDAHNTLREQITCWCGSGGFPEDWVKVAYHRYNVHGKQPAAETVLRPHGRFHIVGTRFSRHPESEFVEVYENGRRLDVLTSGSLGLSGLYGNYWEAGDGLRSSAVGKFIDMAYDRDIAEEVEAVKRTLDFWIGAE